MRYLRMATAVSVIAGCAAAFGIAFAADNRKEVEDYVREPMPAGIQVVVTELEGPVFADAKGHTLYTWPAQTQRNGNMGEVEGKPGCYDIHYRETAGIAIPYPAGLEFPNADTRPTCIQHWPPVYAAADAKPVGNFTILERTDGTKQWAYKEYALYTSHLDKVPGETAGGTQRKNKDPVSSGARRIPAQPAPLVPPKFTVATMFQGRLLTTDTGASVYSYDRDTPAKSSCVGACLVDWEPILAPDTAVAHGEWAVIERPGGRKQWTFRGKPLYRYLQDSKERAYDGSDIPGWHNVFVQHAPTPKVFQAVDTDGGQVLADASGKTLYTYQCAEDTPDTLFCDDPGSSQEYRFAMCGAGDPDRCVQTFPYVIAAKDAKADSIAWGIKDIDPKTGRYVAEGTPGSLHIWTFRGRPIYTFARDRVPGDIEADVWGTAFGSRNGFGAIWVRDVFVGNHSND